jgi:hypothetical protein
MARVRSNLPLIAAILFILLLINPAQCTVIININSNYPSSFQEDEDTTLDCYYKYEKQLESYTISVSKYNTNEKIYSDNILLNDKYPGEHSPISKSINLGEINAGIYVVELESSPSETKIRGDFASDLLKVSEVTGNILINIYNDINNNGNKDATEGLLGRNFRIGKVGEPRLEYEKATNESGALFIKLGAGQYIIEQIPINGWAVVGNASRKLDILKDQTTVIEFKNIPTPPVSEENFWRIVLILFFISLFLCVKYKNRIFPNRVPTLLRLLVMLILYLIVIKLTELAGFDPYENVVISIIGCILIAPVLHKLAELLILEFLAKYTVGSAVAVLLNCLDILHNIESLWGAHTPPRRIEFHHVCRYRRNIEHNNWLHCG